MNNPVLHWKTKVFTGLTGTASVSWDMFDFSSAPFPASGFTVLRCMIDIDAVAISTNDITGYPIDYAAKVAFSWKAATLAGGIVNSFVMLNNTNGGMVSWALSVGGAGSPRLTATAGSTANVFNIHMGARIVVYADVN